MAELRFTVGGSAIISLLSAGFVAASLYLAWQHAFHLDELPAPSGRRRWIAELGRAGNGWVGVCIWLGFGGLFGWWLRLAVWRFATDRPALMLREDRLVVHPSYGHRLVPLEDIQSATLREESGNWLKRFVFPTQALDIALKPDRFGRRRKFQVRSIAIDGDREALAAFAEVLRKQLEVQATPGRDGGQP